MSYHEAWSAIMAGTSLSAPQFLEEGRFCGFALLSLYCEEWQE